MPSITLRPINLHWILNQGDDVTDLCAQAAVEFRIGSLQVCSEADGEWTVSAAAIHLLRTLTIVLGDIEDDELIAVLYRHRSELAARLPSASSPVADDSSRELSVSGSPMLPEAAFVA